MQFYRANIMVKRPILICSRENTDLEQATFISMMFIQNPRKQIVAKQILDATPHLPLSQGGLAYLRGAKQWGCVQSRGLTCCLNVDLSKLFSLLF